MAYYTIIDFSGELKWTMLPSGRYAVDPMYLKEFLNKRRGG